LRGQGQVLICIGLIAIRSVSTSYGAFGSVSVGFDLTYGGTKWGNFGEVDGVNSGRFLHPPEFAVFHDKGNMSKTYLTGLSTVY
jgi:hypothetical protein